MRGVYNFVLSDPAQAEKVYRLLDKMCFIPERRTLLSGNYETSVGTIGLEQEEIDSTGINDIFITGIGGWRGVTIIGESYNGRKKLSFSANNNRAGRKKADELAEKLLNAA